MTGPPTSPVLARVYDPVMALADRFFLARYRGMLAKGVSGTVLDLGAGTGAMLPYYERESTVESVIALEPDPAMRRRGRARSPEVDIPVQWIEGIGEALPLADQSVDVVVCSVVLCTVDDPPTVLEEAHRVLGPGGELRVLEHVAAHGLQGRLQRTIRPLWRRFAGGCHPDRATDRLLARSDRFEAIEARTIRTGVPPIRPFHFGRYRPGSPL